jgi:hypothetical protein
LKVAVIVESFTTCRLLTVTPEPDTTRDVVPVRWLPVRVTLKLGPPRSCEAGLIAVSAAAVTVNVVVGLPPGVCTVTVLAPVPAPAVIVNVAVMVVAFTFVKLLTVTPVPDTVTPVAAPRFVPVMVTGTVAPRAPLLGEIPVTVGARTVNALLRVAMPLRFVTVTFLAPVPAPAEMVNVAVTVLALTTLTLLAVTPPPDTLTVGGLAPIPDPVMVTGTAVPRTPEFGETPVTAVFAMVNVTALLVPPGVVTVTFLVPATARRPI